MIVLILNGPAEAGKGEVTKFIQEEYNVDIFQYSSIDYVKNVAEQKFGWDGKKDTAGRNLLAGIKQLMIAYNDLPTKKVIAKMTGAFIFYYDLFVIDIREPDEIEKMVKYCIKEGIKCITCRIINKKAEVAAEVNGLSLTGDRLYGAYDYDIIIDNNGTLEELRESVIEIFYFLKLEE